MLADFVIEKDALILRNLNKNGAEKDVWSAGSGSYGFYTVSYEKPLTLEHYYYQRFTYKFTTTNQSPTWSQFYLQGGYIGGPTIRNGTSNLVANTEYTASGIQRPTIAGPVYTITSGTLYNGNNGQINGVSAQAKNILIYDITMLRTYLRALNIATTDEALKTWCDNNLDYVKAYTDYDISDLITSDDTDKIYINKGTIIANNFIECDGMKYYSVNQTLDNYFDNSLTGISIYNNSNNGAVTHERVDAFAQGSPFYQKHKYVLKVTTNGTASPYAGGLVIPHTAAANKIFVEKIVAKIPTGYTLTPYYNPQGDNASVSVITNNTGTGNWEEYTVLYKCGATGSFSGGGHLALVADGSHSNTSVTWYIAYANNCDITGKEYLKYYTALQNKEVFKDGNVFNTNLDTVNLFANGDASDRSITLPTGWSYDTEDVAGNAKASFVQGISAAAYTFPVAMPIDPASRYKISYWVKCKREMNSFLTAIQYYIGENGTNGITHTTCQYVANTKTTLAQALNTGDTVVYLTSAANWVVKGYSRLGFRNNAYTSSYNDKYTYNQGGSAGCISAVDKTNNTITLSAGYSGTPQTAGTVIVESFDSSTYVYPIQKAALPTDNEWKYVEGYFGVANGLSDGAGGNWTGGIPSGVRSIKLQLNLYANTPASGGTVTVPIKYSDIRIEQVSTSAGHRYDKKIAIKRHS